MSTARLAVPYAQHVGSAWRGRTVTTLRTELSPVSEKIMWSHGGRKYHRQGCQAHYNGKSLWDTDEWSGWPITYGSLSDATVRGKFPCLVCKPEVEFPPLYRQNFGHRPVNEGTPLRPVRMVCERCIIWTRKWSLHEEGSFRVLNRVDWPCTSARVLGLVS